MSTPPHGPQPGWDPQHWGEQQPGEQPPPSEQSAEPQVTYNAAQFDDDEPTRLDSRPIGDPPAAVPGTGMQPPASGSFAQPPTSSSFSQPSSGSFAQPPTSSPATPPVSGSFAQPPATGSFGEHRSGSFAQPPASGSFTQPTTGYAAGQYGQDDQGSYDQYAQPGYGQDQYQYGQGESYPQTAHYEYPPAGYPPAEGTLAYGAPPVPPGESGSYGALPPEPPAKKSKKGLWFALGGVLLVGAIVATFFVLTSGFDGIQNTSGKISNAASTVDSAKTQWEGERPDEAITVSDQSGCYFVVNEDDIVENQMACGPSRRYGATTEQVWDLYTFDVSGDGDNQQASNLTAGEVSQPVPSGKRLVDVEGNEPADDGSGLAEPELPKAEANTSWDIEIVELDEQAKTAGQDFTDATLIAPGASLSLLAAEEYDRATIDGKLSAPADGQKFVVVTLTGGASTLAEPGQASSAAFDLGGQAASLSSDAAGLGERQYLVSMPDSGESYLNLSSGEKTQSLSLITGARTTDAGMEIYYSASPEPKVTVSTPIDWPQTPSSAGEAFELDMTVTGARLAPYIDGLGWAPDGSYWIEITFTHTLTLTAPGSPYSTYLLDCMSSTVSAGGVLEECWSIGSGQGYITASVPAGTTTVDVGLNMTATASAEGSPDATAIFEARSFSVAVA